MLTLVGFIVGQPLEVIDGRLAMLFKSNDAVAVFVTDANLAELDRRGWLVIHDDDQGITITESGSYWAKRWADVHLAAAQAGRSGPKLTSLMVLKAVRA